MPRTARQPFVRPAAAGTRALLTTGCFASGRRLRVAAWHLRWAARSVAWPSGRRGYASKAAIATTMPTWPPRAPPPPYGTAPVPGRSQCRPPGAGCVRARRVVMRDAVQRWHGRGHRDLPAGRALPPEAPFPGSPPDG